MCINTPMRARIVHTHYYHHECTAICIINCFGKCHKKDTVGDLLREYSTWNMVGSLEYCCKHYLDALTSL